MYQTEPKDGQGKKKTVHQNLLLPVEELVGPTLNAVKGSPVRHHSGLQVRTQAIWLEKEALPLMRAEAESESEVEYPTELQQSMEVWQIPCLGSASHREPTGVPETEVSSPHTEPASLEERAPGSLAKQERVSLPEDNENSPTEVSEVPWSDESSSEEVNTFRPVRTWRPVKC